MAYGSADSNSFAEFQLGEGFNGGLSPKAPGAAEHAQQFRGYEGYPEYLNNFGEASGPQNVIRANEDAFGAIQDDAFAGYVSEDTSGSLLPTPENLNKRVSVDQGSGQDQHQSFHTFLHKATTARSQQELTHLLSQAVQTVPASTSQETRQRYYELAQEVIRKRRKDLRFNPEEVEIQSNIGWLVNPSLPKTGGFNAVLNQAVGATGSKMAALTPEGKKAAKEKGLAQKAKTKANLAGLGLVSSSPTVKYVGLGVAGLVATWAIWNYWWKDQDASLTPATPMRKRNRRKKK